MIKYGCKTCKENDGAPRRLKLTVGSNNLSFNYCVVIYTMFLQLLPVLHLVDEATYFTAASFLPNHTSTEIWRTIFRLFINAYMFPPYFLAVDQGSNYVSKEMR